MPSLTWYINRLGRMSPAELAYRFAQAGRTTVDRLTPQAARRIPQAAAPAARVFALGDATLDPAPYVRRAERIIEGRYTIFDLEDCDLGPAPNWNRDPLTSRVAPLVPAASLDYRDENLVGDIKYLWEPNRHLHIPALAQAYALTREARYADALQRHISSWIDQCPSGLGANWASSLELAIRLINWSLAWQWLGGYESALFNDAGGRAFRERWLGSVFQHTRAITRRFSRFSSANNHLIGEAAGVWIAALTWDSWPQMRSWGLRCKQILLDEMFAQNAEDGGNREQAFSYQQFVLDFMLLSGLAARANGQDFPPEWWERMERMLDFIASMLDAQGRMPMVGDADDGYVVNLSPESHFDNFKSLLATGALVLDRADLAAKAGALDHKTRWLLGASSVARFDALRARRQHYEVQRRFPKSGYYLLGDAFGAADEIRMLIDAGPLGFLSIAAHGHADALSIALSVGGRDVLVDPGTYAYHTKPQWREYFRSTRAHNTVLIDGQDQSKQVGNFMWSQHASARCLAFESSGTQQRFVGEHDGYRRLSDPVVHRREITFDAAAGRFEILDAIDCQGAHSAERRWHFAETLSPGVDGEGIAVDVGAFRVRLVPGEALDASERHYGGEPSQGGWVSRGFGRKTPAATWVWKSSIRGRTHLRTHIYVERK